MSNDIKSHPEILVVESYEELAKIAVDCMYTRKTMIIHGDPGVGKSAFLRYLCDLVGIDKDNHLIDLRLNTKDAPDVGGLQMPDHSTQTCKNFPPEFFPRGEKPTLLALEEISTAQPHIQTVAYEITHDRRSGNWSAHNNTLILALGNLNSIGSFVYPMPGPLANRLCHVKLQISWKGMREYAVANWHPLVVAYLDMKPENLYVYRQGEYAFRTPRSWEDVADTCNLPHYEEILFKEYKVRGNRNKVFADSSAFKPVSFSYDENDMYRRITGGIGMDGAADFRSFLEIILKYRDPVTRMLQGEQDTINGLIADLADNPNALYAIGFVLGEQIKHVDSKMTTTAIQAICKVTDGVKDNRELLASFFMNVNERSEKRLAILLSSNRKTIPAAATILGLISLTAHEMSSVVEAA